MNQISHHSNSWYHDYKDHAIYQGRYYMMGKGKHAPLGFVKTHVTGIKVWKVTKWTEWFYIIGLQIAAFRAGVLVWDHRYPKFPSHPYCHPWLLPSISTIFNIIVYLPHSLPSALPSIHPWIHGILPPIYCNSSILPPRKEKESVTHQ